jgi:glutaconate CoA-transferase subunit A
MTAFVTLPELVARVPTGARLAVGGHHFARLPLAALRMLAASRARDLRWFSWGGGLPLEMLLAADRIASIDLCFSSLDIFGLPPRFRAVAEAQSVPVTDWPALAMIAALEAAMRNLPSLQVQLPIGSDLVSTCPGLRAAGDGLTAHVCAIRPDVALLHAPYADTQGNVAIYGARALDVLLAGAARQVLVTVEEIVPEGALARMGRLTVIPRTLVSAVAYAPEGAAPASCLPHYVTDWQALSTLLGGDLGTPPAPVPALLRAAAKLTSIDPLPFGAPVTGPATVDELMAIRLASLLDDDSFASAGAVSPLANVAYRLAKTTHAPRLTIATFTAGHVDVAGAPLTLSLYEAVDAAQAVAHAGGEDTYAAWYQAGRVTHEIIGAAQVDARARVNNIALTKPSGGRLRLAGQGGMADVTNMHANAVLYITRHSPQSVVNSVDFASSARGLTGAARAAAGYRSGRVIVLTNLCQMELAEDGLLTVTERMPGVTAEQITAATGFTPRFAASCPEIAPPQPATLALLRERIDPLGLRRTEFVPARDRAALLADILGRDLAGTSTMVARQADRADVIHPYR